MSTRYGNTVIDSEELAYNTYAGGHSRSNRRGRVRFPDGVIRSVRIGVADSYFTMPAHGFVRGKYVSGLVMYDEENEEFCFIQHSYGFRFCLKCKMHHDGDCS